MIIVCFVGIDHFEAQLLSSGQKALICGFFENIRSRSMQRVCENLPVGDICTWNGLPCENSALTSLFYESWSLKRNFQITYVPPTIRYLRIADCHQHFTISTRSLPWMLIDLILWYNRIYRTFDLTNLPRSIETIHVSHNSIVGPLNMSALPDQLYLLYMSHNKIRQHYLRIGLTHLGKLQLDLRENHITNISVVQKDGAEKPLLMRYAILHAK